MALTLSATDAETTVTSGFANEGDITLAAWVFCTGAGYQQFAMVGHFGGGGASGFDYISTNGTGNVDLGISDGGSGFRTLTPSFSNSVWTHCAFTYNATTGEVVGYINGASVGSNSSGTVAARGAVNWIEIGPMSGQMQDMVVLRRVCTAGEIALLARSRKLPFAVDGWWPLLNTATALADYSGKGRNMTFNAGSYAAGTSYPPVGWGAPLATLLDDASVAPVALVAAGANSSAGAAALTVGLPLVGAGANASAGAAALTVGLPVAAAGANSSAGAAALGVQLPTVGAGANSSAGAATLALSNNLAPAGANSSAGSATLTVTLPLVGAGANSSAGQAVLSGISALGGAGANSSAGSATLTLRFSLSAAGGNASAGSATLSGVPVPTPGGAGGGWSSKNRRMLIVRGRGRRR